MKSVKYLEMVREKHQLKNDAALAKTLGVGASAMSHYMSGRRVMDEETCLAVAMALEINPLEVMMAAGIDRAEKTGQKSLWQVFSQRTAQAASVALVGAATLLLTPTPSEAAPVLKNADTCFALCQITEGRQPYYGQYRHGLNGCFLPLHCNRQHANKSSISRLLTPASCRRFLWTAIFR